MNRRVLLAFVMFELATPRAASAADRTPEASTEQKRHAQQLYDEAMKRFDQDDYEDALRGFQESYKEVKSPNSHFMIARSLARLGRNVEAYKELTLVIEECDALGSRYSATEQAAYAKRDEVSPRIAVLTVTLTNAPKGTKVLVADEPIAPHDIGKPMPVLPGDMSVVAVTPDGKRHQKKVTIRTGEKGEVELDLTPEKHKEAPKPEAEPAFDELGHGKYAVELGLQFAGETVPANDKVARGAGPGARLYVNLFPRGFIDGVVDNVAVGIGADWMVTNTPHHVLIPLTGQWNFWITDHIGVLLEPGVDLVVGAGTKSGGANVGVQPVVYAGARYAFSQSFAITVRAGIPDVAIGLSIFF